MNSEQWEITPKTITHAGKPAFKASWLSGRADLKDIKGLFWHDVDTGNEDDRLLIFDFEWKNGVPEQARFEEVMKKAGNVLDNWISERF